MSQANLVPEQWLPTLKGEGVEAVAIAEPFVLAWGVGDAEVLITHEVTLAIQIIGWGRQVGTPATTRFYVIRGDGDALTIGWDTMREWKLDSVLSTLVVAQQEMGLALTSPSPRPEPMIVDMDGKKIADMADPGSGESERDRLAAEAAERGARWGDDFIDPSTVPKDVLYIGRRSLEWMREELMASGVFVQELQRGG